MTHGKAGERWYLAQLKPNAAAIAQRNLERQGFRTFLPVEEGTRRHRGRFVTAERPLFPGYVFVAFDAEHGPWRQINSTRGIARLVSFGRDPAPVPRALMARLGEGGAAAQARVPRALPRPGDRVRVTKGPFADFLAEIERVAPDRRVWILLELMGGRARVSVDRGQLRAL